MIVEHSLYGQQTPGYALEVLRSDEEFTLEQVRDECVAMDTLVEVGTFGRHREHLLAEAKRIQSASVNGQNWSDFDVGKEWVRITRPTEPRYVITTRY